ncbi:MAG TPA: glycoside hydrolase family 36 protein [Candidatus Sulfotelmatobacter sp.]|nr:glycoside hydrolase family 36 protein [Candidatus Sulfotelmatobacter sp.]
MSDKIRLSVLVSLIVLFGCAAIAQTKARLRTSDTELALEALPEAPRVAQFDFPGQPAWQNRASEALIPFAEISGEKAACSWKFNSEASRISDQQVVFVYDSASPHLRLSWEWRTRQSYGPLEHQVRIENLDNREMWIPMQDSLAFDWQVDPKQALQQLFVEKGANTPSNAGTHQVPVGDGFHWTGTSSTYGDLFENQPREIIPWTLVERNDAARSGWYAGIEFSGRIRVALSREKDSLKAALGLNPDPSPFRTRLKPGESFESPVVFFGGFRDGPDGAGNVLRPWVRAVLGNPETWKDPNYPLVVNNSWGGGMQVNEEIAERMIRDSAELGVDMFHIDAGWFRDVGDWYPNPEKFPRGLAVIADDAHKHGLKFGIWVDWTQAGLSTQPGALNARDPKVRNWMVTDIPQDWKPEPFKGQTIDIGVPEAKEWAEHEVNRIITDYHLDMLEHDGYLVAHGCDRADHPHAAPDPLNKCVYKSSGAYFVDGPNATDVSYHAVRAYYEIYSKMRQSHPGLLFEVCNDGGRMVDFGTAAHGDYFSITDTYDPLSNRRAFYDTSHVLPAAMLESYVEKWPVPRIENFRYMLRSGMMGWLTIMLDTNAWSAEQHAEAKKEIALYKKELRGLIRDANLYHVSPRPDGVHWDGIEYWDPERKRGVLYAFRGTVENEKTHSFVLHGLQPAAQYLLKFHDSGATRTVTGSQLLSGGVNVALNVPNSSELIFIEEVSK